MAINENSSAFELHVFRAEISLQIVHNADPALFPLFEPNVVDSYITNHKINRIVHLQNAARSYTDPKNIQSACYELLCLRQAAQRAMLEEQAKKRTASAKATISNLSSLTAAVTAVGSLILFVMGNKDGKAKLL